MRPPANYTGVLLLDPRDPKKKGIKLSTDQKSLVKSVLHLIEERTAPEIDDPLVSEGADTTNDRSKEDGLKQSLSPISSILASGSSSDVQHDLSALVLVLSLEDSSQRTANSLYRYYCFWKASKLGKLIAPRAFRKLRYSILPSSEIKLVGMDNWRKVMCYMDSLLVSMFYSSDSFDFILDSTTDSNLSSALQIQVEELKVMLRFIVSLMRAGEYIPAGIIEQLCLVLNSLGCDLTLSETQQDALQLYEFLAESLSLPLLTMKLDIIHSGKLSMDDDLRLIQERTLLISVPRPILQKSAGHRRGSSVNSNSSKESFDEAYHTITLEECLNDYFNNSVTVRRHLDRKRLRSISRNLTSSIDASELNQYEKMGIVHTKKGTASIDENPGDVGETVTRVTSPVTPHILTNSINFGGQFALSSPSALAAVSPTASAESATPSVAESAAVSTGISTVSTNITTGDGGDRASQVGSINKVSERIEASRTRSSTIVSVLNNVPLADTSRLTRRASSVSNSEVTLPAWMFLQLLPYYTDPSFALKFENHEEIYRSRNARSRTIDSADSAAVSAGKAAAMNSSNGDDCFLSMSEFDRRFCDKRPVVPICLKRYAWDNHGRSHKIRRKVQVPEVMRLPYFIAPDRTKPGFVDFRRNSDNKAPCGSFMLVLESCVCHRGVSVDSGHYVSLTRKAPFNVAEIRARKSDESSTSKDWLLFNDLMSSGKKVTEISFSDAMASEDPYILFYKIVEIDEDSDDVSSLGTARGDQDKYGSTLDKPARSALDTASGEQSLTSRNHSTTSQNSEKPIHFAERDERTVGVVPSSSSLVFTSFQSSRTPDLNVTDIDKFLKGLAAPAVSRTDLQELHIDSSESTSSLINRRFGRFALGNKSRSRSISRENDIQLSLLQDISPTEQFYLDIFCMYYWYQCAPDGSYVPSLDFYSDPGVELVTKEQINQAIATEEAADGGFMDRLNTTLQSLKKRGSIAGSSSASSLKGHHYHYHHHHHHPHYSKHHNQEKGLDAATGGDRGGVKTPVSNIAIDTSSPAALSANVLTPVADDSYRITTSGLNSYNVSSTSTSDRCSLSANDSLEGPSGPLAIDPLAIDPLAIDPTLSPETLVISSPTETVNNISNLAPGSITSAVSASSISVASDSTGYMSSPAASKVSSKVSSANMSPEPNLPPSTFTRQVGSDGATEDKMSELLSGTSMAPPTSSKKHKKKKSRKYAYT
ncbi:hypothetical protein FOA43_003871 [Brettanomyces nanus]|uniref:ubiquitinyl hydrolase 1 n=1 Tax=Eeniella nana TaxID=13502 RepID=A0A875S9H2_EENNA|nr:uncharacterized protein FOA43_003871 [Brettanomyces nanus]QPG76482.1 hypothetical protein FOA43_003871 [Brettanomyces nanus]